MGHLVCPSDAGVACSPFEGYPGGAQQNPHFSQLSVGVFHLME